MAGMDFLARARTLVRIVEARSFSAAARTLRLSLPAISRQVSTLESELGAKLFTRTTRSLHLTDEGRRFHEHALRLIAGEDAARASVRPDRAVGGTAVVTASVTLGTLRIVPHVPKLFKKHPGLGLELRLEDRVTDLVGEGIDLAVRVNLDLPDSSNLIAQPLATFRRVLVAAPSYLRRSGTPRTAAALTGHAAIGGLGSGSAWTFEEKGQRVTVDMPPRLRVATLLAVREAAVAGLGLALLPDFVVAEEILARRLQRVLPGATLAPVTAHALYRVEQRGSPRIEALLTHLRSTLPLVAS
jgi:DNA-binding transcriptional LysR family regulator